MTGRELAAAIASREGMRRDEAREVVEAVVEGLREALCAGHRVEIRGFGTLRPRHYPAYRSQNPRTGSRVEVAPKVLPVFKCGKDLGERVNNDDMEHRERPCG